MKTEYFKSWSHILGRDMELKVYGHAGKPVLVFPSSGGRFFEYEDFGMIEACRPFIEDGRIQMIAVDGWDRESWMHPSLPPAERVRSYERYEEYILNEVLPFIREQNPYQGSFMTTGCSMGGYHAANFLFRHPDLFDGVIALSGLYSSHFLFGEFWDESFYFHFPLSYLPGLEDAQTLERLRQSKIVLCVGQGDWETCEQYDCVRDTRAMKQVLDAKGIPSWVDVWGDDAHHDWEWWRMQMPYFLGHFL